MITYDFSGRHAVVAGAGGGMDEAITLILLAAGAAVTAVDIEPQPESLSGYDDRLTDRTGDPSDTDFSQTAIFRAGEARGGVDHLANVAGVLWFGRDKSAPGMDMDTWDEGGAINLAAAAQTARAALPYTRRIGRSRTLQPTARRRRSSATPAPDLRVAETASNRGASGQN
ncbi:SDR family NAD(P)-dependent oxidoreductase [Rhizobiaceae sp. 2RAB30]